jgi:hypothetical protein
MKSQGKSFDYLIKLAQHDMASFSISYSEAEDSFEIEYCSLGEEPKYKKRCYDLNDFIEDFVLKGKNG